MSTDISGSYACAGCYVVMQKPCVVENEANSLFGVWRSGVEFSERRRWPARVLRWSSGDHSAEQELEGNALELIFGLNHHPVPAVREYMQLRLGHGP